MTTPLPQAHQRWRCGGCGNLTRFDVTRSRRTTEFWHFDLAGEHEVEETETKNETVELVACRWCGRSDAIEVVDRASAEVEGSRGRDVRPEELPDRVRARVISYAADALGVLALDDIPAPLKRVANFAPNRRGRLGANQIMALLESDDGFRHRIAVQARARQPEAATELDEAATTVDASALAFLERPDGWQGLVGEIAVADQTEQAFAEADAAREQLARLTGQVQQLTEELREQRQRSKESQDKLRGENADLRRKLGESRVVARQAEQEAEEARRTAADAESAVRQAAGQSDAEVRRLRARLESLEADLGRASRASRADRDDASIRARLLLDTLLQATQGLRHELGLPVLPGAPADRVAADLAEPGVRTPSGSASLATDDPALLQQYLSLPNVHVIVDGYNVTKTAWAEAPLEQQRNRLLRDLGPVVARNGVEMTVVFDGGQAESRAPVQSPRGVRVLFSKAGVIADDVIRDLVDVEPQGRVVLVVTSDRAVIADVTRKPGVRGVASAALVRLLSRS